MVAYDTEKNKLEYEHRKCENLGAGWTRAVREASLVRRWSLVWQWREDGFEATLGYITWLPHQWQTDRQTKAISLPSKGEGLSHGPFWEKKQGPEGGCVLQDSQMWPQKYWARDRAVFACDVHVSSCRSLDFIYIILGAFVYFHTICICQSEDKDSPSAECVLRIELRSSALACAFTLRGV